jgi:hypothetical protein
MYVGPITWLRCDMHIAFNIYIYIYIYTNIRYIFVCKYKEFFILVETLKKRRKNYH